VFVLRKRSYQSLYDSPHPYRVLSSAHSQSNHDRLSGLNTKQPAHKRSDSANTHPHPTHTHSPSHYPHHILLLPSYRNRALAHLKPAGYARAVEDCPLGFIAAGDSPSSWTPASEEEDMRLLGGNYERIWMETSSNPKPPSGRKFNTLDAWQKWKKATYALLLPSLEVVFWEDL